MLTVSSVISRISGLIMCGTLRTSRREMERPMNAPEMPWEIALMGAGISVKPVNALTMPTASMEPIMAGTGMPMRRATKKPATAMNRVARI